MTANETKTEFYKETLANGLRVVTVEMPHLHSAEMICYLAAGGRDEKPDHAGISHFLEHMLFRGTVEHPTSVELEKAFEALGGTVNASTDAENTCYHSRLHPDHIEEGAALFASMLQRPLFKDIDLERKIILEEALEDLNEKGEDVSPDNHTAALLWPGHPLSVPTIGTEQSLSSIAEDDLRAYHRHYYTPTNTVIAVTGRVRHQQVVAAVQKAFGSWQGPRPARPLPVQPAAETATPELCWVKDSDSQVNIQLAFRTPGRHAENTAALRVLRWILSWGGTSRLMLHLREHLGLTYNVEANLSLYEETGCLAIDLSVAPENLVEAVKETLKVVEDLRRQLVPEEELAGVTQSYRFDLDFSRDHTEAMATRYGWGELTGYLRTLEQDRREVCSVTPEQVREAASTLLTPGALKAALVGPWSARDRKKVEDIVAGFGR